MCAMGEGAPEQLRTVLATVNASARYQREPGCEDRWQTPDELRRSGAGDCEDFAIAYWCGLRGAWPAVRLACLLFEGRRDPHMVCLAGEWVLDVLADAPYRLGDRSDVLCVAYTLGERYGEPTTWVGGTRRAQPMAKWAELLPRLGAGG